MQTRRFLGVGAAAATVIGLLLPMEAAVAATACVFSDNTTTHSRALTGDCDLSATLDVADGWSIDGNGHTITVDGTGFTGPIIQSASGTGGGAPASMTVGHLNINAVNFGNATGNIVGILFDGAKGRVNQVSISGVSQGTLGGQGYGVEIANTAGATFATIDQVKIDNGTTITGYRQAAVHVTDGMRFTVLRSTIGSPDAPSAEGAAGILVDGLAHGAITENHISLSDAEPASPTAFRAGVKISESLRVEVKRNVFTGNNADFGVSVENPAQAQKTTAAIDCNLFNRSDSSASDTYGVAVAQWGNGSKTNVQLTNATFTGNWKRNSGVVTGTTVSAGPANVHDGHCPPTAPTNVVAKGGDGQSKVVWHAAAAPGPWAPLSGYKVSAKAAGHPAIVKTVGAGATSAKLTGLNNSRTYKVTVTAQSSGGQANGSVKLYPTKVSLSASPGSIHHGGSAKLSGTLSGRDPNGRFSKRTIEIWAKPKGGHWSKIGTVKTKGGGHFSRIVKPRRTTTYKAVYGGHPGLASHATATVIVKP
jgi:hypothetical protein